MVRVSKKAPAKKKTSPARAKKKSAGAVKLSTGGATKSKSRVNEAGNYTKPAMRKRLFYKINRICSFTISFNFRNFKICIQVNI